MNVFVTGANGLLGTALVRKLAKRHKVTAFVLKGTPMKGINSIKNVAIKFGNILDPKSDIRYVIENKRVFRLKEDINTNPNFYYFF